jgi:hypothetical protein
LIRTSTFPVSFRFQKFTGDITAAHVIIVLTDVTVKKDATGIGSGYHIEKSTHVTIVLAGPSLQKFTVRN